MQLFLQITIRTIFFRFMLHMYLLNKNHLNIQISSITKAKIFPQLKMTHFYQLYGIIERNPKTQQRLGKLYGFLVKHIL